MSGSVETVIKILIFVGATAGVAFGLAAVTGGKAGSITQALPAINIQGVMSPINTNTGYSINIVVDPNTGIPTSNN